MLRGVGAPGSGQQKEKEDYTEVLWDTGHRDGDPAPGILPRHVQKMWVPQAKNLQTCSGAQSFPSALLFAWAE